jgi:hypothetical protein
MSKIIEVFSAFETISSQIRNFIPTYIYCEGWLLRLVMTWFNDNRHIPYDVRLINNSTWYSEASLLSVFKKITKNGKEKSEGPTYCDAIYGDIVLLPGSYKIELKSNCKQLVVVEAKMYSKYSSGTSNAKGTYNQASRIICCMCNLFKKQNMSFNNVDNLAFYTFIPNHRPKDKKYVNHISDFNEKIDKDKIGKSIEERIKLYTYNEEDNMSWFNNSLKPFINKLKIDLFYWEDIIEIITKNDKEYGTKLMTFYDKCIKYNTTPGIKFLY